MKFRIAAVLTTAAAALMSVASTVPAQAIEYVSDTCNYTDKSYCFGIFYNSTQVGGVSTSPCYLSSQQIEDHWGVSSPNGNIIALYQFGYSNQDVRSNLGGSHCEWATGSGQGLKNNAASVVNGDAWASYTVYYNSYFNGTAQTFDPNSNGNLIARLHNNNASHRRNG
ncbi:hypothetical protein OG689_12295 [Kitasatospora sp. NBC_00240]|uniref:hypothetical protein n=1 Tax=Kitasatospora sp. NBC_00240 TaxID=2903567 RepID=UPI002254796B|nr:hypothetical protein [Kitasatospora sp. NBC_00240]MCX5210064.1 hypothetical protein [Kitasatospora sp. NBC_00240]